MNPPIPLMITAVLFGLLLVIFAPDTGVWKRVGKIYTVSLFMGALTLSAFFPPPEPLILYLSPKSTWPPTQQT